MHAVAADMDINIFRGIIIVMLITGFLGMWVWAWSRKRKTVFHELSMLPLEEDNGQIPDQADGQGEGENNVK